MFRRTYFPLRAFVAVIFLFLPGGPAALAQGVPAPEEIIGFEVGTDFHLASFKQAHEYFQALEESSPMIKLVEAGKTTMGKPMLYAVISSEENLARLDRYKEISKKLALTRGISDDEALRLAAEGKAVVWIDGGLHSTEVAPAQHLLQLAYDLLTSDDSSTRLILDNVILVLVFANPDGMDLVAEWYHPNVGTPFEVSAMPWLYHKYVGHDNNRDSYMVNQVETQHLTRLANQEWYPRFSITSFRRGPSRPGSGSRPTRSRPIPTSILLSCAGNPWWARPWEKLSNARKSPV